MHLNSSPSACTHILAGCWQTVPDYWGGREPLSPEEHGDSPGSEMSDATELLGDPGILTNDRTAPMGIASPTAIIVPSPNIAEPEVDGGTLGPVSASPPAIGSPRLAEPLRH